MCIPLRYEPTVLLKPKEWYSENCCQYRPNEGLIPLIHSPPPNQTWALGESSCPMVDKDMISWINAVATAFFGLAPFPARMGVMTRKGTAIKPCNKNVPKNDFPSYDSILSLSSSNWNTNAELLNVKHHQMKFILVAIENPRQLQICTSNDTCRNGKLTQSKTEHILLYGHQRLQIHMDSHFK